MNKMSAASGVISHVSAALEHSAAEIVRRSATVAGSSCISRPPTHHDQEVSRFGIIFLAYVKVTWCVCLVCLTATDRTECSLDTGGDPSCFLNDGCSVSGDDGEIR